MFILVAWIYYFVYISNDVVRWGYIHLVFIIFVLESMVLQVVQVELLLVVFLLIKILFKYEDHFGYCL